MCDWQFTVQCKALVVTDCSDLVNCHAAHQCVIGEDAEVPFVAAGMTLDQSNSAYKHVNILNDNRDP